MGGKEERSTHWGEWQGPKPRREPAPRRPRSQHPPGPFLTVRELASLLRISPATIYRLLKAGRIKGAFKIGNDWRFNKETLEDWIAAQ